MAWVNENYTALQDSYLFSQVAHKVADYSAAHPETKIIRLGIGDVTKPLPKAVIEALHKAVDEQANAETFRGYAPDLGYEFLRHAVLKTILEQEAVISQTMKYLFQMELRVIQAPFRRSFQKTLR